MKLGFLEIAIILGVYLFLHISYDKKKAFQEIVDRSNRLINWALYVLTALISFCIIFAINS